MPTAIVIGAGLSGLTAAYRLDQAGIDVTVLESADRIGGRVQTVQKDGYSIDTGAGAISDAYAAYIDLAARLGLHDAIIAASSVTGVVRDGRIHCLDTRHIYRSALGTRLFSWRSKLKLLNAFLDVYRAKRRGWLDYGNMSRAAPLDFETAADYAARRLNTELRDYLTEPIVRVMLMANADKISKVEFLSGLANIFEMRISGIRGGVGRLPRALAAGLDVKLAAPATGVERTGAGAAVTWRELGVDRSARVDACVVACPLQAAGEICREHRSELATLHKALRYSTCITVAVGTRAAPACKAFVLQLPRAQSEDIALLFLEHNKVPDCAPPGRGLIVGFWEEGAAARMTNCSDHDLVAVLRCLLEGIFPGLSSHIEMTHVTRWPVALPVTRIGCYQAIGEFAASLDPESPVQFASDYLSAAGQNTAVESGNRAARNVLKRLGSSGAPAPGTSRARRT